MILMSRTFKLSLHPIYIYNSTLVAEASDVWLLYLLSRMIADFFLPVKYIFFYFFSAFIHKLTIDNLYESTFTPQPTQDLIMGPERGRRLRNRPRCLARYIHRKKFYFSCLKKHKKKQLTSMVYFCIGKLMEKNQSANTIIEINNTKKIQFVFVTKHSSKVLFAFLSIFRASVVVTKGTHEEHITGQKCSAPGADTPPAPFLLIIWILLWKVSIFTQPFQPTIFKFLTVSICK